MNSGWNGAVCCRLSSCCVFQGDAVFRCTNIKAANAKGKQRSRELPSYTTERSSFRALNPAGKNKSDVVRLLGQANPILDCRNSMFADLFQRQVAVGGNGFNQALFAKFSKLIFRLRNTVTKSDKDVTGV